ncbi:uncharacterized protein LOC113238716 isoform X3 [Hyposmocoma kahamanoa]|uniref:uncharacterized protein LOC113238716 isoform X3 n=1 Tax=Hyposmocoma kahamanoa TaxID=1477025 RepID=UPI000E6D8C61|nr:uncharacterized protein LOC113238716 isoform X3 [Hyposmocoma kahamanoa]
MIADPKKINKLPPIPKKVNRDEPKDKDASSPAKRAKEDGRGEKKKRREDGKDGSGSSPEKRPKGERKGKRRADAADSPAEPEVVAFKELRNYHKERYMRRNKEKSESPDSTPLAAPAPDAPDAPPNVTDVVVENKDVDLRVLPIVEPKAVAISQKRPSTEMLEGKVKKNKLDKFDILFGNEDVDLRQLPQVDDTIPPLTESPKIDINLPENDINDSPQLSPKKDWNEVKEKTEEVKRTPSKLDLVRAKLAEATKGKDRLGRPLLYSKSPSIEKERRRTVSSEDTDMRTENTEDFDAEDHKKTISIIMNQAKEQFNDGQLDKNQYNTLMYQVLQLNEKLKLKEAKQRESLELSKRKLKAHTQEQNNASPKAVPNTYGDIDERVVPYIETPSDNQGYLKDSDMRMLDTIEGQRPGLLPLPPTMPIPPYMPYANNWRGPRPRVDEYMPRRFRRPTAMEAPPSATEYTLAEPLFAKPEKIPGLETPSEEKPPTLPILGNINVNDLFAKLVASGIVPVPNDAKPEAKDRKEEPKEDVKNKTKEDKTKIHRVDLLKPETLRGKQPGLVAALYGGMQCSGCGARFPPEHTVRYSQHLDWHFRQNRRDRDSARRAHSRHWHYDLSDWVQYEEVEDLEEREKSWFETGGAEGEGEGPVEAVEEAPSVAAGAPQDHFCATCGDKFDQFYNEDKEEWHLRNSVRHEDKNYHPMCFEDYKASLTKEEPVPEVTEVVSLDKEEEAIEIRDIDDINSQSDDEVVEVVEPEKPVEALEIDEEEGDDDVVLKAEPVEQVVVNDDADTDDETMEVRKERDRQAEIDFSNIKVKQEPIDPDDEPIITAEEETVQPTIDTTHITVLSSIDGNVQLDAAPTATSLPIGGIRINISKSIPSFIQNNHDDKMLEDISADDEPLPPGEEPELDYKLKPTLEGVQLSRQPPLNRGTECSGLCSIM